MDWSRIEDIFSQALERSPEERDAYLDEACGGDVELRRQVETLLSADAAGAHFLTAGREASGGALPPTRDENAEDGAPPGTATAPEAPHPGADADVPETIGPFRVLDTLGEGGMGVVYLAEQTAPLSRRVALKLIRWGMDSGGVVRRFESERQTLALLNHPHIAQVYEAGVTQDGRPYFAMEYAEGGVPITTYCDERHLGIPSRLELFIKVCEAVQYAHQKGVIHRDIKPSNILVSPGDGNGRAAPKVIDFGIAKATEQSAMERSLHTATGQIVGTPGYMSPEQAAGDAAAVDTRTDIYSLGALLYELLVGTLPIDSRESRGNLLDFLRRIREEEPATPSTRVVREADSSTAAELRETDVRTLRRQLRGDLDWISLKALEKDPERRYASASELAADIERHLRHQPVLASPPGVAYRLRKFVRRHRWQVAAAGGMLLVLVAVGAGQWAMRLAESRGLLADGRNWAEKFVETREQRDFWRRQWRERRLGHATWQPYWERADEIEAHRRLREAEAKLAADYDRAVVAFRSARDAAPPFGGEKLAAERALEDIYFDRYKESRLEGSVSFSPGFFKRMIETLDLGTHKGELEGSESVALYSDPPGADVYIFRYAEDEAHLVPLPFDPRAGRDDAARGILEEPFLRIGRVREGHETFRAGDRWLAAKRTVDGAARTLRRRGDLAAFLKEVGRDEAVSVEVSRSGETATVSWTPYPGEEVPGPLRTGRLLDPWAQFGFLFEGYPLVFDDRCRLGQTSAAAPIATRLPEGSYLLVCRKEGFAEARLPLLVPSAGGALRLRLYEENDVPRGFVHVPAGSFAFGGDPAAYESLDRGDQHVGDFFIARREVVFRDYLEFINHPSTLRRLEKQDARRQIPPLADWSQDGVADLLSPELEGVELIPRFGGTLLLTRGEDGRYGLDRKAVPSLELDWPVFGISFFTALEFARWVTEKDGGPWRFRLPTEFEWEKAARGADRRTYVWGSYPVYSFCRSRLGLYPRPRDVSEIDIAGIHPMDESVFGVLDMAGSMSEPVLTVSERIPRSPFRFATIRGANWDASDRRDFHVASRNRLVPEHHIRYVGLRLVAEPPGR